MSYADNLRFFRIFDVFLYVIYDFESLILTYFAFCITHFAKKNEF